MNIISIMAHQDDEMFCLGTMLKYRERGDKLFFITVTDGSKGFVQNPAIFRAEAAEIRDREMSALATALGAGYINLREPDEFLYDSEVIRMKLIEAIRKTEADVIFTHFTDDYNLDHTTVNLLVKQCAMQSCLPVLPTQSVPLKEHPAIFMVEPLGFFFFSGTYYVDIGVYNERKLELLKKSHISQEEAMQKTMKMGFAELCARMSAYRGSQVGCAHAECFAPMQARGAIKAYPVLP